MSCCTAGDQPRAWADVLGDDALAACTSECSCGPVGAEALLPALLLLALLLALRPDSSLLQLLLLGWMILLLFAFLLLA
jgi:hypothetical protein